MKFICLKCNKKYSLSSKAYKCKCGGLFKIPSNSLELNTDLSLGEVKTPLLKNELAGHKIYYKLDYYQPTGSFKDRGAKLMIGKIKEAGIQEIVEDSSGNAGSAVASYAAVANIKCGIYIPKNTSSKKIQQIKSTGAIIHKISGSREDTFIAVKEAAKKKYYASHIYNPLFFAGVAKLSEEIVEELEDVEEIILPLGNGSLLLGVWQGLKETLKKRDLPSIIAAQATSIAPIWEAFHNNSFNDMKSSLNLAEGISIKNPVRINEIIKVIKESKGNILLVNQIEIQEALDKMWRQGIYVEPTSAVGTAVAIKHLKKKEVQKGNTVIILTGSGLKYDN